MNIEKIDKNFVVETKIEREGIKFYDCRDEKFEIRGVIPPIDDEGIFLRMPEEVAKSVSNGVAWLNTNTAGGRVRFKTDSPYVAINVEIANPCKMSHMPFSGSMNLDLYEKRDDGKEYYLKSFISPEPKYEQLYDFPVVRMREVTLNMPLYSGIKKLYIGLSEDAVIEKCAPYSIEKPMVYYGSSVTQGGCASRPGNSYQGMISRRFDCDHINLGFSGNAKGEKEMAEYIAGLDMSIFIYDYDHNAPDADHLEATHKPMFDTVRKAHPELPIIMASRCDTNINSDTDRRYEIIKKTYDEAVATGDKNVYLIDGRTIMASIGACDGMVDGCHPNDLGFYAMAVKIGNLIENILKQK